MKNIFLIITQFFLKENITQAKKTYLFSIAFVLWVFLEYIMLTYINTIPMPTKYIFILSLITGLLIGIIVAFFPKFMSLLGIKNLYIDAIIMSAIFHLLAFFTKSYNLPPIILFISFIFFSFISIFLMKLSIFMSNIQYSKKNTNHK